MLLEWYGEAGVDEAVGDEPVDYFAAPAHLPSHAVEAPRESAASPGHTGSQRASPTHKAFSPSSPPLSPLPQAGDAPLHHTPAAAIALARELADKATNLEELEAAVRTFDGCAIKKTASKTVFSDGNPKARVMIIGEAPGAQEDRQGIPFCGPSGQLLDRMFAAIGLDRTSLYISNTVFWRPPGNRQPSQEETAICLPFVEKHIALVSPDLLILSGGTATTTLLQKDTSISRLRGKFYEYSNPYLAKSVPTLLIYHPSYLLRQPSYKRLTWKDLQLVKEHLNQPKN